MNTIQRETIRYDIANFSINLKASASIHSQMQPFCYRINMKSEKPRLDIEIITDCEKDGSILLWAKIQEKKETFNRFELKAYNLFFDKEFDCYYFVGGNLLGKYDRFNEKAVWYINEEKFYARNIFHICILDILCLSSPKYESAFYHGAVVSLNSTGFMFIGNSGSGKSTITQKLSIQAPCKKICDDVFSIAFKDTLQLYPINSGNGYIKNSMNDFLNTSEYVKLYETSSKIYFLDNSPKPTNVQPKHVFLLDRKVNGDLDNTIIQEIKPDELIKLILSRQANVPSKFTKERYRLLKKFCSTISANLVVYSGDCNINSLYKRMCQISEG